MIHISVLYVDDDVNLLAIVKLFLEEKRTIMVDTAISDENAQNKLTTRKYDAIVSDYEMLTTNGIVFFKYVRKSMGISRLSYLLTRGTRTC